MSHVWPAEPFAVLRVAVYPFGIVNAVGGAWITGFFLPRRLAVCGFGPLDWRPRSPTGEKILERRKGVSDFGCYMRRSRGDNLDRARRSNPLQFGHRLVV